MSQEPLGSAGEEALRLLSAAEQWVRARSGALGSDGLATGSPECTACPFCQAVGALRHVRPDTVAHLLDAAAALTAAVRTVVQSGPAAQSKPGPPVQRIDLDGDGT